MRGVTLAGIPSLDDAVDHVCGRNAAGPCLHALLKLLTLREGSAFALQTLGEICSSNQHAGRPNLSDFVRGDTQVVTVRDALRQLGYRRVYSVWATCFLARAVDAPMRAPRTGGWWRRAVRRAVIAQQVAVGAAEHVDTAFAAALLGDLGDLLLPVYFPDLAAEAERFGPTPANERAAWGYTRHDIAAGLVRHWGVPDEIADAVAMKRCMHCDRRPQVELVDVLERARQLDQRYLEHWGAPLAVREIFGDEPALADRLEREGGLHWLHAATEHIVDLALTDPATLAESVA